MLGSGDSRGVEPEDKGSGGLGSMTEIGESISLQYVVGFLCTERWLRNCGA